MTTIDSAVRRHARTSLRMLPYVAALCWATPEATAGSLPPATFTATATAAGDAEAEAGGLPTPYAYATASGGFWESSANAGATYYFEVVSNTGATGGVQIQVTTFVENEVLGPLTPIYPPSVFYEASAIVSVGGDPINSILAGYDYGPSMTGSILQTSSVNVTIGVQTEISVAVVADAYYVDGFMLAFADPMITVPSGFTLELSPGVGNSSPALGPPAPEPGSFTLLGIAAVCSGFHIWRRRRQRA